MKLQVTEEAASWYEKELEINDESYIRFYVRYGGSGGLQPGFSLAIMQDQPREPIAEEKVNNVRYFIEAKDEWYFDDYSLKVSLHEGSQEPEFIYE
ncbi:HesB/YadR/YfhF family protein [Halobacillus sp. Marseille-Q1614]|uniref:HesB/YadR/YfhF family protein n=1 Tax=Halobacillus sp. Marseille-Q1614 TaxID=2709134 RepID=UPI001570EF07|nr:HesB/YadR/YfhF family protein [Halobacillus sp. Marseille-Q1614]